ncbi:MAG: GNAT family N-acetyltransferase [Alphaproteobacteria bacterium]
MQSYTISALSPDKIDQAYPVAMLAIPDLALERWRSACRAGEDGGFLVALDPSGHIRGLCQVSVVATDGGVQALQVTSLAFATALDVRGVADAMLDALIRLCGRRRCSRLAISVAVDRSGAFRALARARDQVATSYAGLRIDLLTP